MAQELKKFHFFLNRAISNSVCTYYVLTLQARYNAADIIYVVIMFSYANIFKEIQQEPRQKTEK
jgi:hypothetical protein